MKLVGSSALRSEHGPFDFAQGRFFGTWIISSTFAALKRWAKLGRPFGAGFSGDPSLSYRLLRREMLT
jgi:hypothetical protein